MNDPLKNARAGEHHRHVPNRIVASLRRPNTSATALTNPEPQSNLAHATKTTTRIRPTIPRASSPRAAVTQFGSVR